jgi:hypothetical protein
MKIIYALLYPFKLFSKGVFLLLFINLLILSFIFIFESCKKYSKVDNINSQAKARFLNALNQNRVNIGSTTFAINSGIQTSVFNSAQESGSDLNDNETIFLNFPSNIDAKSKDLFYNIKSIQELSNMINSYNAILQCESSSSNYDYQLKVPVEIIKISLIPLISESKQYLYSKDFSDYDISEMMKENNGTEEDLILFVMSLTQAEKSSEVSFNLNTLFVNTAFAKLDTNDYIRCAVIAIGADVLWSLGTSDSSKWTKVAMKKAFGVVAKKLLGPIGVCIAVVSFSICIAEAHFN